MSSRRSTRKRKCNTADISSSWYVGYAEDGESVEAIMQKFQELERMQQELAAQGSSTPVSAPTPEASSVFASGTNSDADADMARAIALQEGQEESTFTQAQLEELFKRTSCFTVKQATLDLDPDDLDELELWRLEMEGGDDDDWEENDNHILDDDMWDDEFGPARSGRRGERIPRARSGGLRSKLDRESLIAKYKVMQIQMQDRNGNFFVMKKRVCTVDPRLPTYIRIPPVPIPRSWVKLITSYAPPSGDIEGCRYFEDDILHFNMKPLGNRFQVVHMNPPFLMPDEEPTSGKISMKQFEKLDIPAIIPFGFLFIWAEKELTPDILRATQSWGFRYVENFAWIKRERSNKIARQSSRYFNKSKTTCLILRKERKEGDVELRHQRSPDCEFDFIKPKLPEDLTEEKPNFVYDVIETLLPQAVYGPANQNGDRMLDLWAKPGRRRKGWTMVVQKRS
ncbi:uncharacterized protein SPPG_05756 [Spizellomyces punctatus DAOM BR117]|uniref:MT-A70-domain-containing protein n=1 Tax=Spizellomyces punctatus (strain DAOM BR117) TaxID=645134 RepID=A0A0L0HC66_SPIPD|nr:uncharacterized protein SPPG_05756 [Spizellomyces punctatus DAOM BR117]KNC98777.1 hypothetical protein SPPG_05756 [Spizellomyces punctatus DAOM BR117]|eukprot:XP_016606817.1 hypothetical protein SPPG_05756 [Spizellomyces punctatus DAOM BR117]